MPRTHDQLLPTVALLLSMGGIAAGIGWIIGGEVGAVVALAFGAFSVVQMRPVAVRRVLARLGAQPVGSWQAPGLVAAVRALAGRAGIVAPPLFVFPSRSLQAMAIGDDRETALVVSTGLLDAMPPREVAGVLAHELSHVRNGDLRTMALAQAIGAATAFLARAGLWMALFTLPLAMFSGARFPWLGVALLMVAPTAVALLRLALSRTRELEADADAARLTGDPGGLAAALVRLERQQRWLRYLIPFAGGEGPSWLSTHPPTKERVRRLLARVPSG